MIPLLLLDVTTIEAMHKHLLSYNRKNAGQYAVLGIYDTATETLVPKMDHIVRNSNFKCFRLLSA